MQGKNKENYEEGEEAFLLFFVLGFGAFEFFLGSGAFSLGSSTTNFINFDKLDSLGIIHLN
jgi:hypothetical protein